MKNVMSVFEPEAIVFQAGADSLAYDIIGLFNLTSETHGKALNFMLSYNIPTLLLGGGGYNIKNVAKLWTYETALCLGVEQSLPEELPKHTYSSFYNSDEIIGVYNQPSGL